MRATWQSHFFTCFLRALFLRKCFLQGKGAQFHPRYPVRHSFSTAPQFCNFGKCKNVKMHAVAATATFTPLPVLKSAMIAQGFVAKPKNAILRRVAEIKSCGSFSGAPSGAQNDPRGIPGASRERPKERPGAEVKTCKYHWFNKHYAQ